MRNKSSLLSFFLIFLLLFSLFPPLQEAKAAGEDFGYIYFYFRDMDTGETIKENITYAVPLTDGMGDYISQPPGISGYEYQYATIDGVEDYSPSWMISVTSANTISNPIKVYAFYKSNITTRTVTTYGMLLNESTGDQEIFTMGSTTVNVYNGNSVEVPTSAPTPSSPLWTFLYATNGINGTHENTQNLTVTVSDQDVDVYYWFKAVAGGTADVMIVVTDNILNPDDMVVINEPDGKDYFDRYDISKTINGYEYVPVSSPSGGRAGYKFAFAVVEHQGGNPNTALTDYVARRESTNFNATITTDSPNWYVHFYWIPEGSTLPGDPTDPGGGGISFTPNTTLWTNQGKSTNGSGAYPVNVRYTGPNPAVGQGTVTYTHTEIKTGTTGNPPVPYEYTVTTDYSLNFDVMYPLDHIDVSGDTSDTINGAEGTVYIEKEGENLKLNATGYWGEPEYTIPSPSDGGDTQSGLYIPPPPENPTGSSGNYDLDWTNPTIGFSITPGIVTPSSGAVEKTSKKGDPSLTGFFGNITAEDNLSGISEIKYAWTFGSSESGASYETIYSDSTTSGGSRSVTREIEKPVGDNLYLHVRLRDIAGNTSYRSFGPYEDPIWIGDIWLTDIKDPSWGGYFTDTNGTWLGNYFKANELPIDKNSFYGNIDVKKGYAFYFNFETEYLYRLADYVTVEPKFYYYNGTTRGQEVDIYYNLNNNPFVQIGSALDTVRLHMRRSTDPKDSVGTIDIGSMSLLRLTDDVRLHRGLPYSGWQGTIQYNHGKKQNWYGKYLIPGNSVIVPKGMTPRPENVIKDGYILINFQVRAWKLGAESQGTNQVYSYVPTQWIQEGGPKSPVFQPGDIMIYDNRKSAQNDFEARIIW